MLNSGLLVGLLLTPITVRHQWMYFSYKDIACVLHPSQSPHHQCLDVVKKHMVTNNLAKRRRLASFGGNKSLLSEEKESIYFHPWNWRILIPLFNRSVPFLVIFIQKSTEQFIVYPHLIIVIIIILFVKWQEKVGFIYDLTMIHHTPPCTSSLLKKLFKILMFQHLLFYRRPSKRSREQGWDLQIGSRGSACLIVGS